MTAPAVRWLQVAVEQYETLPVSTQILVDNALAQVEQDAAGPHAVPHPDGAWSIAAGQPADHLFAHTQVIGQVLVVMRIIV
jgi:hypothetical protein